MLNKVVQRPVLVTGKATAPSVVMRSRQEKRSKGWVCINGGVDPAIWNYFHMMILHLGTKWRMPLQPDYLGGRA